MTLIHKETNDGLRIYSATKIESDISFLFLPNFLLASFSYFLVISPNESKKATWFLHIAISKEVSFSAYHSTKYREQAGGEKRHRFVGERDHHRGSNNIVSPPRIQIRGIGSRHDR